MADDPGAFKVGDVVVLKSGGPSMTVTGWDSENDVYWCKWFDGGTMNDAEFLPATIEPVG